jgi:DNA-binding transcriptional MerR regulator
VSPSRSGLAAQTGPVDSAPSPSPAERGPAVSSIGEVLAQLRPDFPDVSISKIRFLEAEGLVEPGRTPAGYRKFSRADVSRLRYVLAAQRDQYLPLRVIKQHLDALDRGLEPPPALGADPQIPVGLGAIDGLPGPAAFGKELAEVRLSRAELTRAASLTGRSFEQLEQYGLIAPCDGSDHYDGDALVVAKTVAEMARFGLEARHLRPFRTAADREAGLFEQVVTPLVRQRNGQARAHADEVIRELAALSVQLHASLVRTALRRALRS